MYLSLKKIALLLLLVITTMFVGCKKESDPVTAPSEHFEPLGWLIRDATQKPILVVWEGVIQTSWNGNKIADTLYAPLNALSDHYSVKFLDANKNIINPPASTDYSLGLAITDTSVVKYIKDSPTDWAFHIQGKKSASTTVELQVKHIGHVDVRTPKIPVKVIFDSTAHGEPVGIRLQFEEGETFIASATSNTSSGSFLGLKDSTSEHIAIEFFDDNNHYFQPETPLHSWTATIADPTVLSILPESEEPWVFRVKGLKKGQTTVVFKLIVSGSAEFIAQPITFNIQ